MRFEIRLYPNAIWDDEQGTTVLGDPGEIVTTIDAAYPAQALELAEATILATRTETTQRTQRGKRVTLTTYWPCLVVTAAWQTARGLMALARMRGDA
jgi:hypothetical protein